MPTADEIFDSIKTVLHQPALAKMQSCRNIITHLNTLPASMNELLLRIETLFNTHKRELHPDWQKLNPKEMILNLCAMPELRNHPHAKVNLLEADWDTLLFREAPFDGDEITLAGMLLRTPECVDVIINYPQFQEKLWLCNWDTAVLRGEYAGLTIAWAITDNPALINLLISNPQFQEKFVQTNWAAAPLNGDHAGENIAWRIATLAQTRARVVQWLMNSAKAIEQLQHYKHNRSARHPGETQLEQLTKTDHGRKLLRAVPTLLFGNPNLESALVHCVKARDQELTTALLIQGAQQTPNTLTRRVQEQLLKKQAEVAATLAQVKATWETLLQENDIHESTLDTIIVKQLLQGLPECEFLTGQIREIVGHLVGYSLATRVDELAAIFVHLYERHHIATMPDPQQQKIAIANMRELLLQTDQTYLNILKWHKDLRASLIAGLLQRPALTVADIKIALHEGKVGFQSAFPSLAQKTTADAPMTLTRAEVAALRLRFYNQPSTDRATQVGEKRTSARDDQEEPAEKRRRQDPSSPK